VSTGNRVEEREFIMACGKMAARSADWGNLRACGTRRRKVATKSFREREEIGPQLGEEGVVGGLDVE
jgi:hypothetical protein